MIPSFIQYRSLAHEVSGWRPNPYTGLSRRERIALFCALTAWRLRLARMVAAAAVLLAFVSIGTIAGATEPSKPAKCTIVYINSDAVIICPKAGR